MIMNYRIKIVSIVVVLILIIIIIINSKNKVFIPENKVIKVQDMEKSKNHEFTSCQLDCTMNDGVFHKECVGYNGCTNSLFLRNKSYCEKDSDCVLNLGCCYQICKDEECLHLDYCEASNKNYVTAHDFSCKNNIICSKIKKCRQFSDTICLNNICRIVD